jgi:hypothetical protein
LLRSGDTTIDVLLATNGFAEDQPSVWRDHNGEIVVAVHPLGAFVGWVDTAWPHPSIPVLTLQDVRHIPRSDAQPVELLHSPEPYAPRGRARSAPANLSGGPHSGPHARQQDLPVLRRNAPRRRVLSHK